MSAESDLVEKLTTLNRIGETLNQAVDVRSVLNDALADLVRLMGLETGWIFVKDPAAVDQDWGSGYVLAAHHNLPPALALENQHIWHGGCACEEMSSNASLDRAYNEVQCTRLQHASGERRGLVMHASVPLSAGGQSLGILNVAAPDWSSFNAEALTLLTNVGQQIGIALERARLFDMLKDQRVKEQAALLALSNQLLSRLDLDDLMGFLVDRVRQILQADACALLLPENGSDSLEFRAASGWRGDPVAEGRHMRIDEHSGPGLVMRTLRPLQQEDVTSELDYERYPAWLQAEGFRGSTVVPLIADGHAVGALAVSNRQPRMLDADELRLLRLMGNQAAMAIDTARLHRQEVRAKALVRELELGREIQLSLLPKETPVLSGWEFAAYYEPANEVGGDFYDYFELPGSGIDPLVPRLGIVIADVVGKGVPAALFMALSRTLIRSSALKVGEPLATMLRANELIRKDNPTGEFLTALHASLDPSNGRFIYVNAGHNPPLWLHALDGQVQELTEHGIVLGILEQIGLRACPIDLAPGDCVVLYTDGVTEAMNASRQLFGDEQLQAVVAGHSGGSAQEIVRAIVRAVHAFADGAPASDDVTLFVMRRLPPGER